jgi:hypothetical protein
MFTFVVLLNQPCLFLSVQLRVVDNRRFLKLCFVQNGDELKYKYKKSI